MALEVVNVSLSVTGADPTAGLEPGPFTPIDVEAFPFVVLAQPFTALVGGALDGVAAQHDAIDTAHATIVEASDPAPFDFQTAGPVSDAGYANAVHGGAFDQADPAEVIATTNAQDGTISGTRSGYDQTPPSDIPPVLVTLPPPPPGTDPGQRD
jgi:hypothetical protein